MAATKRCLYHRQLDDKRRASPCIAFAPNLAVHGFDHAFDDGQSQTRGVLASGRLGAEPGKFAEQFLLVFRRQSRPFVPHFATDSIGQAA